jgi:hypothetical protein
LDVGEAMPGDLDEPTEDLSAVLNDWSAARAAMERAIGPLRDRVEEIGRETRERFQEPRAVEEEVPVLHERKMTIYEDAEPGPLDELRFPPGLERGVSETEVSAISHSPEPTTETLVEEPEQVTESPAEGSPEKVVAKLETHEFPEVDSISREELGTVRELDVVPEEPVVGPEPSQVSSEEPEEEAMAFDEAQPSQEVAPILQEAPLVSEEPPIDLAPAPLIPSDRLSSIEEASDTQSEHISSSLEFPRPHTPHPIVDEPRATSSPVPFPVTNDHEDQGYGTQEDEDRTTQVSQRAQGKHVHWGSVEAQPAYERLQDEEDQAPEEHSPPFSRLLLPAPPVTEPQPDARPERAARLATRRAIPPPLEKPTRKFEQGVYTVSDVRWGMALDLPNGDNRSPIAFGSHGWENQQWEFRPCGSGFIVKNVGSGSFLVLEDLQRLKETSVEVVTGDFPTCWEMEVMDNGRAEDGEDENEDVYTRIRLPRSEMALGFKGGYAGAQLYLTKDANNMSTYWRLRVPRREQVVKNPPLTTTESIRQGGVTSLITTTSVTTTTTSTVTRIVMGDA